MKTLRTLGIMLVGFCILYAFFCGISAPQYELNLHDANDNYSSNLIKKDFRVPGICRWMESVFAPYDEYIFVTFHTTPLFDTHFQSGLVLVFINDIPQYTLEINSIYSKSLEFQDEQIYLTKQYDPYTRIYTLDGKYVGKETKRELLYSENRVAMTDDAKYEIKMIGLLEAVVKTNSNGTEQILYKSPGIFAIKYILFYFTLAVGMICVIISLLWGRWTEHNKNTFKVGNGKDFNT